MFKLSLFKKLPSLEQASQVFAVIALVNYSWATLRFFYRFPSWLFYSSVGEINVYFSYLIVVNLLESALLFALYIVASLFLPPKWFHERFVSRSISLTILGLGYLIYVNYNFPSTDSYPLASYTRVLTVAVLIVLLAFLVDRVAFIRNQLDGFANRAVVFLYVIIPVSAAALLVVLFRNIF